MNTDKSPDNDIRGKVEKILEQAIRQVQGLNESVELDDIDNRVISQALTQILEAVCGEVVKPYEDYIKLLVAELDEVVPIASVHGWKSSRYEQGKIIREKLTDIQSLLRGTK